VADLDGDGYTNLEEYLHWLVEASKINSNDKKD
jgi:hypothetical protein